MAKGSETSNEGQPKSHQSPTNAHDVHGAVLSGSFHGPVAVGGGNAVDWRYSTIVQHYPALRDYIYDFKQKIETATRWFVGRDFVFDALETFIRQNSCGYFRLIAEAGLGKTALAAEIAKRYSAPAYFYSASEGRKRHGQCLNHLCAQLVARYELPYDHLPERAGQDPSFLRRLMREAVNRHDSSQPLLIVIDALDEADPVYAAENWLSLPPALPEGVYILLTHRPGDFLVTTNPRTPVERFTLNWDDPHQQKDITVHLRRQARRSAITSILESADPPVTVDTFVSKLRAASQGNFMYLDYELADIERAEPGYHPLRLDELPHGLTDYYDRFWERMKRAKKEQGQAAWNDLYCPVIALLGVAQEPVTEDWLATHSGREIAEVREQALDPWRRFLGREQREGKETWRIVHQSFADFLAHKVNLTAAHGQVAERYLVAWGGLQKRLPGLHDRELRDLDDGYGLLHLAAHLEGANRAEELHHLLRLDWVDEVHDPKHKGKLGGWLDRVLGREERAYHNVWHAVREAEGDTAGYSSDIARAWRLAEDDIGLQIRYALIASSLNSYAQNIAPKLLALALDYDLLSPSQALLYASKMSKERQRSEALVAIVPYLKSDEMRAEALAISLSTRQEKWRVQALISLCPNLPEQLLQDTLAKAREIEDEWERERLLLALAAAPAAGEAFLQRVLEEARVIQNEYWRGRALSRLAPHLRGALLEDAVTAVKAIGDGYSHACALGQLVLNWPELAAEEVRAGIAAEMPSTALAPAILYEEWRALALERMTTSLGKLTESSLWGLVGFTGSELYKWWLTYIAPMLSSSQPEPALEKTLVSLFSGSEDSLLGRLSWLAPHLTEPLLLNALAMIDQVENESHRLWAIVRLLPHLSGSLLESAAMSIFSIEDEYSRSKGLKTLAQLDLPSSLWKAVLAATRQIAGEYRRAETLLWIVARLPSSLHGRALAIAHTVREPTSRTYALLGLIPHLSESLKESSVREIVRTLASGARLDDMVSTMLTIAARSLSQNLLVEVTAVVQTERDRDVRLRTLAGLVAYLSEPARREYSESLLNEAMKIQDSEQQTRSRIRLVAHLPEPMKGKVLEKELQAASKLPAIDLFSIRSPRFEALAWLAPHLPEYLLQEQAAEALEVRDGYLGDLRRWASATVELAPYLPESLLRNALTVASDPHNEYRAIALARLVPRLAELGYPNEALEVVDRRDNWSTEDWDSSPRNGPFTYMTGPRRVVLAHEKRRVAALINLLPYLPQRLRYEALRIAQEIGNAGLRAKALAILTRYLPEALREDVLEAAMEATQKPQKETDRVMGLAAILPHLSEPLRAQTLQRALVAAKQVQGDQGKGLFKAEDERTQALIELACRLAEIGQSEEALRMAEGLPQRWSLLINESPRAKALAKSAPYFSRDLMEPALKMAQALPGREKHHSGNSRAMALAGLAKRLASFSPTSIMPIWRETLPALATRTRENLLEDLGALAPVIQILGGEESVAETFHAIQDVGRWWS